ncbi:MAG: transporter substrate-binding domain-containing protein [Fibrobacterales bacterium]
MNRSLFIVIVILAFVSIGSSVTKKVYTVGVEELDYLPFYSSPGGVYTGFGRDILDKFSKDVGVDFVYQPMPIKRLYRNLVEGQIDFKFPDSPNWGGDLKKGVHISYSEAVIEYLDGVLVKPTRKGMGIDSLSVVGTLLGFTPEALQDYIDKGKVSITHNPSFSGLLHMVLHGRIDGAYVNPVASQYILVNQLKESDSLLVFDPELPYIKGSFLLSTIKHKKIITKMNHWLTLNQKFIKSLYSKYGVSEIDVP